MARSRWSSISRASPRPVDGGGPAFGAAVQRGDIAVAQRQAAAPAQQLGGFVDGEAQGGRRDLQQPPACAQPAQADFGGRARADHQHAAGRHDLDQLLHKVQRGRALQRLQVIQHERERLRRAAHLLQDALRQPWPGGRRSRPAPPGAARCGQAGQGGIEVDQQPFQVVVPRIQAQPRRSLLVRCAMRHVLLHQRGLAEAGRGTQQDHAGRAVLRHARDQVRPPDGGGVGHGRRQLGREHRRLRRWSASLGEVGKGVQCALLEGDAGSRGAEAGQQHMCCISNI
ncbi:hypothetical protein [Cupriavidus lacunae]|uniref:hypothetical protein n=1 Tax=Cupriavidus lacunae TaxID=2666307 RepID=UPI001FC9115C|nr:hypothetical protein [Cupriavidus lacunae]